MGRKIKDITGSVIGMLTVLRYICVDAHGSTKWACECECGNIVIVAKENLKLHRTISCGCFSKKNIKKVAKTMHFIEGTIAEKLNKTISKNNTSGYRGVSWHSVKKRWEARIGLRGKFYHLGYFESIEDAIVARENAEEKLWTPILESLEVAQ
jgi:hypothetical protein